MEEIAKKLFVHLIDYEKNKDSLYPTTWIIKFKNKDTLKLSFAFIGKTYLEYLLEYVKKENLYFYIQPEDNYHLSLVIRSSQWADMNEQDRMNALDLEQEIELAFERDSHRSISPPEESDINLSNE